MVVSQLGGGGVGLDELVSHGYVVVVTSLDVVVSGCVVEVVGSVVVVDETGIVVVVSGVVVVVVVSVVVVVVVTTVHGSPSCTLPLKFPLNSSLHSACTVSVLVPVSDPGAVLVADVVPRFVTDVSATSAAPNVVFADVMFIGKL